jgi:hypothetical protein
MAEVPIPRPKPRAPERAYNRERNFRDVLVDIFRGAGASREGTGISPNQLADRTELFLDVAPVTGQIRAADKVPTDIANKNYGSAALNALGALPGGVAPAAKNALRSVLLDKTSGYHKFGMVKRSPNPLENDKLFGSFNLQGRGPGKQMTVTTVTDEDEIGARLARGELSESEATNLLRGLTEHPGNPFDRDDALLRGFDLTDAVDLGIKPGSLNTTQMTDIFGPALRHPDMSDLQSVLYQRVSGARGGTPYSAATYELPVAALKRRSEKAGIPPAETRIPGDPYALDKTLDSIRNRVKPSRRLPPHQSSGSPARAADDYSHGGYSLDNIDDIYRDTYTDAATMYNQDLQEAARNAWDAEWNRFSLGDRQFEILPNGRSNGYYDIIDSNTGEVVDTFTDPDVIPF